LMMDMPTKRVFLPRANQAEMQVWSEEQVSAFLIAVRGDTYEAMYHLALKLGLRRGELLGLQWNDIDWLKSTIHVRRQAIIPNKGKRSTASPKTTKGKRVIPVGKTVLDLLRTQVEQVQQMRLSAPRWEENNLVFPCSVGTPPSRIDLQFKKLAKAAGLPVIRFHDMRHTAASIMLANGIPIMVVSRILGHSSAAITLRVYGHLMPGGMEEAAELMDMVTAAVPIEMAREWQTIKDD
jgi:integrase